MGGNLGDVIVAQEKASTARPILETLALTVVILVFLACSFQRQKAEAEIVATRIHSQLQKKDFTSIYKESGDSFKKVGDERTFVERLKQFSEENGQLKRATGVAYETGIDSNVGMTYVLVFDLEFERGWAKERITLTRSEDGSLRLWDLFLEPLS